MRDGTGRVLATVCSAARRGVAHLAGIVVARRHRNHGWGRLVTAELTHEVLHGTPVNSPEPVCALSLDTDNVAALASYRRLGYLSVPPWASRLLVRR